MARSCITDFDPKALSSFNETFKDNLNSLIKHGQLVEPVHHNVVEYVSTEAKVEDVAKEGTDAIDVAVTHLPHPEKSEVNSPHSTIDAKAKMQRLQEEMRE